MMLGAEKLISNLKNTNSNFRNLNSLANLKNEKQFLGHKNIFSKLRKQYRATYKDNVTNTLLVENRRVNLQREEYNYIQFPHKNLSIYTLII